MGRGPLIKENLLSAGQQCPQTLPYPRHEPAKSGCAKATLRGNQATDPCPDSRLQSRRKLNGLRHPISRARGDVACERSRCGGVQGCPCPVREPLLVTLGTQSQVDK